MLKSQNCESYADHETWSEIMRVFLILFSFQLLSEISSATVFFNLVIMSACLEKQMNVIECCNISTSLMSFHTLHHMLHHVWIMCTCAQDWTIISLTALLWLLEDFWSHFQLDLLFYMKKSKSNWNEKLWKLLYLLK